MSANTVSLVYRLGMEQLLTLKEVADLTKISPRTLGKYVRDGKLPYVRLGGAHRFEMEAVLAWIEENRTPKQTI